MSRVSEKRRTLAQVEDALSVAIRRVSDLEKTLSPDGSNVIGRKGGLVSAQINELKEQIEKLQAQIDAAARKPKTADLAQAAAERRAARRQNNTPVSRPDFVARARPANDPYREAFERYIEDVILPECDRRFGGRIISAMPRVKAQKYIDRVLQDPRFEYKYPRNAADAEARERPAGATTESLQQAAREAEAAALASAGYPPHSYKDPFGIIRLSDGKVAPSPAVREAQYREMADFEAQLREGERRRASAYGLPFEIHNAPEQAEKPKGKPGRPRHVLAESVDQAIEQERRRQASAERRRLMAGQDEEAAPAAELTPEERARFRKAKLAAVKAETTRNQRQKIGASK